MNLRVFTLAAAAVCALSFGLRTPVLAQGAKFICGSDKYGRPAHCISTTGQPAPAPRRTYIPARQPAYGPASYYSQPYYSQPAYEPSYPAPAYYPSAYSAPAYYPPMTYPAPAQVSSCCCATSKRGLLTNLSIAPCGAVATYPPAPPYPVYAPYPAVSQQTYYPPAEPYPQYTYYQQPQYSYYQPPQYSPHVTRPQPYRPPPPPQRVYGPWQPR